MNGKQRCFNCFKEKGELTVCPHCGYNAFQNQTDPSALQPGTVLNNRYIVGRVLSSAGYSITYLCYHLTDNIIFTLKEYFPSNIASRSKDLCTVDVNDQYYAAYESAMEAFSTEANELFKFNSIPTIVSACDFFKANNTAYLVTQHPDGMDLEEYLIKNYNKLKYNNILDILLPIMQGLDYLHSQGIVHGNITPNSIYISSDGNVYLLDLGKTLSATMVSSKIAQLNPVYAPIEQFSSDLNQGAWTDVYSVAAIFYQCLTGKTPPAAKERLQNDTLKSPTLLGIYMPLGIEKVFLKALAVRPEDRCQSMSAFIDALVNEATPETPKANSTFSVADTNKNKRQAALAVIIILIMIAIVAVLVFFSVKQTTAYSAPHEDMPMLCCIDSNTDI